MLTQTCTHIQASVSVQNAHSQAPSKSQEWGQEWFRSPVYTEAQGYIPLQDSKELREEQKERRTFYCGE